MYIHENTQTAITFPSHMAIKQRLKTFSHLCLSPAWNTHTDPRSTWLTICFKNVHSEVWMYSQWSKCFWKRYNSAWPLWGEPSSDQAVLNAAMCDQHALDLVTTVQRCSSEMCKKGERKPLITTQCWQNYLITVTVPFSQMWPVSLHILQEKCITLCSYTHLNLLQC
jgi:hypothetical protein